MERVTEEEFYCLARAWAHGCARRLGMDIEHRRECGQQFVVKLLQTPAEPARWTWPPERIEAFLRVAARNHAWNYRRNLSAAPREAPDVSEAESSALAVSAMAAGDLSEVPLLRRLFWEKVHSALRLLAPQQRSLLVDYHLHQMTVAAIAEKWGCNVALVRQRLVRARKRLRELLISLGNTEPELRSCIAALCRGQHAAAG